MKIALIGPGSVGTFLACEFNSNHELHLLARPNSVNKTQAMWSKGIQYITTGNGAKQYPTKESRKNLHVVSQPDAEKIYPDLLFITVRTDDLTEKLAKAVLKNASPHTNVVILSNGIMPIDKSFEKIDGIKNVVEFKAVLEKNRIRHAWGSSGASCRISHDDAKLHVSNPGNGITIYPSAYSKDEDFEKIAAAVEKSGVVVRRYPRDKAVRAMFEKLSFTSAAISTIFGFKIHELGTNPHARELLHGTAQKFYKIAEENGVSGLGGKKSAPEYAAWVVTQNAGHGDNHYAMWNSLSSGGKTEIGACVEALCGLTQNINVAVFKYAAKAITAMESCLHHTHPDYRVKKTIRLNEMNREILHTNEGMPPGVILKQVALKMEEQKKIAQPKSHSPYRGIGYPSGKMIILKVHNCE